jgi:hypothetical protein
MDKFDRTFQLHAILSARRTPVPMEDLMTRLECSRATLYRAVNTLKDQLNAPIVYDTERCGFVYERSEQTRAYELPGLWFSATERQALAIMQRLPKDAGGGLLEEHLGALTRRLADLTKHQRLNLGEAAAPALPRHCRATRGTCLRCGGLSHPATKAIVDRVSRPQHRCGDGLEPLAAARRALPRRLVPGCLGRRQVMDS